MKYNLEIARKKVADFGYILDEDVYINNVTRMRCHDNDGYKYLLDLSSIKVNSHPKKFDKSNPFTIYNIQLINFQIDLQDHSFFYFLFVLIQQEKNE